MRQHLQAPHARPGTVDVVPAGLMRSCIGSMGMQGHLHKICKLVLLGAREINEAVIINDSWRSDDTPPVQRHIRAGGFEGLILRNALHHHTHRKME